EWSRADDEERCESNRTLPDCSDDDLRLVNNFQPLRLPRPRKQNGFEAKRLSISLFAGKAAPRAVRNGVLQNSPCDFKRDASKFCPGRRRSFACRCCASRHFRAAGYFFYSGDPRYGAAGQNFFHGIESEHARAGSAIACLVRPRW